MEGSKRSADLIRQLLSISRKHDTALLPIDINDSLRHVQELCMTSFPKSVGFAFNIGHEPLMIMGDQVQIDQILLNICINASHAMTDMRPPGEKQGGVLSVKAEEIQTDDMLETEHPDIRLAGQTWACIQISDTGVGMSEEVRKRIFEPFFTKNKSSGSGLGLSTTYSIVQKHGGRISVRSRQGSGSSFLIYLPINAAAEKSEAGNKNIADIVGGTGTVLIIDDEPIIIDVVKGYLEQCGYTVLSGLGAETGISIFRTHHRNISVVIIDLSMPDMSGLEVFQELKNIDPGVKAILSSGLIEPEIKAEAENLGFRDTINKPYLINELSLKIKEIAGL
jgi:two-component system, cell cycle sensor histidine kinase and response regulator CckA